MLEAVGGKAADSPAKDRAAEAAQGGTRRVPPLP
jgi:hypothetical protein